MNGYLRQATASQSRLIGPFIDDVDFKTAETGLTIANTDVKLRANGTTLSNKNSGGGTHQVNGMYSLTWDATDTATVGELAFSVVVAGALSVFGTYVVVEETVYDQLYAAAAPGAPTGAGIADAVWDEVITAAEHNVNNSAAKFLRTAGGGTQVTIHSGTAQSGSTANTIKLDTGASTVNDIYNRSLVVITGGTGVGQTRRIVDYVGSTRVATVDQAWTVIPSNTSTFNIIAAPVSVISDEGVAQAGAASTITLATTASTADDIYVNSLVTLTSGTGAGQTRQIIDYVGSTRVATVDTNWGVTPDTTSVYAVIPAGDATTGGETGGPTSAEIADAVWNELVADHLLAGSTGEALDAAGSGTSAADIADAVWDEATSAHITPGSTGQALIDAGGAGTPPTVDQIVEGVWDESMAAHLALGTTGATLNGAGLAGDPWTALLPGAYGAGTAGAILGDVQGGVTLTGGTLVEVAEAILKHDFTLVSGEAARSLLNAARYLRNKRSVLAGTLTVTTEDDTTTAWTAATLGTPGAAPITSVDPT